MKLKIGLLLGLLISLNFAAPESLVQSVTYNNETVTMRLTKLNLRGDHFELWLQNSSGDYIVQTPVAERAYLGTVDGYPGATSSGVLLDNGDFKGAVYFDRGATWFTLNNSVVSTRGLEYNTFNNYTFPTAASVSEGQAGINTYAFDIAFDLKYTYYESLGQSVASTLEMVEYSIALIRALYWHNALLRPYLGRVIIRGSEQHDPFYNLGTANELLDAIKSEWDNNHTDANRDIVAGITPGIGGGLAYVGTAGNKGSYSVNGHSGDKSFDVVFRHEMGHNWGNSHFAGGSPEGTGIMGGNSAARFSGCEVFNILSRRDQKISSFVSEGVFTTVDLPPYAALDAPVLKYEQNTSKLHFIDVLANDFDPNNTTLSLVSVDASSAVKGVSLSIAVDPSDGKTKISYTNPPDIESTDWFEYVVADGTGKQSKGVVVAKLAPFIGIVWSKTARADTYVEGRSSTNFGTSEQLQIRRSSAGPTVSWTQIAWLNFDISGITKSGNTPELVLFYGSGATSGTMNVWGVQEGSTGDNLGSDWTETGITGSNAPYQSDLVESTDLKFLGSFNFTSGESEHNFISDALTNFINADNNNEVTILLSRPESDPAFSFQSRENPNGGAPMLLGRGSDSSFYNLNVSVSNGSVSLNPPGGVYLTGTQVTATVTPHQDYSFTGWSGDETGNDNPLVMIMDSEKNITAEIVPYSVLTVVAPNANVVLNPSGGSYPVGSQVTVTVNPNSGYYFSGWSNDLAGMNNPVTVTMDTDKKIIANMVDDAQAWSRTAQADTYVEGRSGDNFGTSENIHVRRSSAGPTVYWTQVGWINFDLSGVPKTNSSSELVLSYASGTTSHTAQVWGIKEGSLGDNHGVDWLETEITGSNAPYQADLVASNDLILLGSFSFSNSNSQYIFSSQALTDFIDADLNNEVTLLLSRTESDPAFAFQSRENPGGGVPLLRGVSNNLPSSSFGLNTGWNLVSFNVSPNDPSAPSVFSSVTDLVIVKNNAGKVFWPAQGNINTIGNVQDGEGYKVYTNSPSSVSFEGTSITYNTPIQLNSGWNLVAYYPPSNISAVTALASIANDLVIVKDGGGNIYWPEFGVNTIGNMAVGQGYSAYMNNASTLIYPASSLKQTDLENREPRETKFYPVPSRYKVDLNTGNNASILSSQVELEGKPAPDYSEIGAFDGQGRLVGSGVVMEGKAAFTIWGQNSLFPSRGGAVVGEGLTLTLFVNNKEHPVNYKGSEIIYYENDAIFQGSLKANQPLSDKFSFTKVSPNPFNNFFNIHFEVPPIEGRSLNRVKIHIYNLQGEALQTLLDRGFSAGKHTYTYRGNNLLKPGVYFVEVELDNVRQKQKIIKLGQ